jgi:hypothetical protein
MAEEIIGQAHLDYYTAVEGLISLANEAEAGNLLAEQRLIEVVGDICAQIRSWKAGRRCKSGATKHTLTS